MAMSLDVTSGLPLSDGKPSALGAVSVMPLADGISEVGIGISSSSVSVGNSKQESTSVVKTNTNSVVELSFPMASL
jgi:hypothetical protein